LTMTERQTGTGTIPNFTSPEFLDARAMECVQLLRFLADFGPEHYLSRAAEATPLNQSCSNLAETAWKRYCEKYVQARGTAYKSKDLAELERYGRWDELWETFAEQFKPSAGMGENAARNAVRDEFQPALAEILHAVRWATYAPESGELVERLSDYYRRQGQLVETTFETAVSDYWTEGRFVRQATAGSAAAAASRRPWDALAGAYADHWVEWCNSVGKASKLPRNFDLEDQLPAPMTIPWAGISSLRIDTNMGDERLTDQLVDFQLKAQGLLSAELSNILYRVQESYFAEQIPYEGWPFLNEQGTGLTALETVNFEQFARFLLAVQRAEEAFAGLEKGLQDDPLRKSRREFFRACSGWRDFLGLNTQGGATPLDVTVWTEDPLGEPYGQVTPDDTAQHFYKEVCLTIGLRLQEAGDRAATRPLCFQTTERGKARATRTVWEFSRTPDLQELTFELVDGLQPEGKDYTYPRIKSEILGRPSPLAFCAYLHRYGRYVDGNWVVSHAVDLAEKFQQAGRTELVGQLRNDERIIGEKFIFQLPSGRHLPQPIPRLSPATGSAG
ncbi:MAG: hypothetical protein KAY37_03925, partial [Phycisphaerae bacterium]|nr:hypothetical protein [Phycisphaerae bacterium]